MQRSNLGAAGGAALPTAANSKAQESATKQHSPEQKPRLNLGGMLGAGRAAAARDKMRTPTARLGGPDPEPSHRSTLPQQQRNTASASGAGGSQLSHRGGAMPAKRTAKDTIASGSAGYVDELAVTASRTPMVTSHERLERLDGATKARKGPSAMLLKILAEEAEEERAAQALAKKAPPKRVRKLLKPADVEDILKSTSRSALADPRDAVSAALAEAASALASTQSTVPSAKPSKVPAQMSSRKTVIGGTAEPSQPSQRGASQSHRGAQIMQRGSGAPPQRALVGRPATKSALAKGIIADAPAASTQTVIASPVPGPVPGNGRRASRQFRIGMGDESSPSGDGDSRLAEATTTQDLPDAKVNGASHELSRQKLGASLDATFRHRRANGLSLAKPLMRAYAPHAPSGRGADEESQVWMCIEQLLRHTAQVEGIRISPDGWVATTDVIDYLDTLGHNRDIADIWGYVTKFGGWHFEVSAYGEHVRATDGHTMEGVAVSVGELMAAETAPPVAVVGLPLELLDTTLKSGLSRRNGRHIQLARRWGVHASSKRGGGRTQLDVQVWINLQRAISDGIRFFLTAAGAILCEGVDGEGTLPARYFSIIIQSHGGLALDAPQARLLERLFAGCARISVFEVHRSFSGSISLRADAFDADGNRREPAIVRIGPGPALLHELKQTGFVAGLGVGVLKVKCGPLCVDARGSEKEASLRILEQADAIIDKPLVDALERGTIRLLRCDWLISRAAEAALAVDATSGAILRRCEDMPAEAFWEAKQAAELIRRRNRSVLVVSHCWQTSTHPVSLLALLCRISAHILTHKSLCVPCAPASHHWLVLMLTGSTRYDATSIAPIFGQ